MPKKYCWNCGKLRNQSRIQSYGFFETTGKPKTEKQYRCNTADCYINHVWFNLKGEKVAYN